MKVGVGQTWAPATLPLRRNPWYLYLLEVRSTEDRTAPGRIKSMKNYNGHHPPTPVIFRDLPACSAVSQPTAPLRSYQVLFCVIINVNAHVLYVFKLLFLISCKLLRHIDLFHRTCVAIVVMSPSVALLSGPLVVFPHGSQNKQQ